MNLIILTLTKNNIKKTAIYPKIVFKRPALHWKIMLKSLQYKVDKKNLQLGSFKYDFKTIYRDMNMMFIWKDKKFWPCRNVYSDKGKKYYPLAINNIFYGNIILLQKIATKW